MGLIVGFLINALALYLITKFVPGFNHDLGVGTALFAALVFALVNMIIGTILRFISAPLTWLTHGLFIVVIDFILFAITAKLMNLHTPGIIPGWEANLIGAVIMMIVAGIAHSSSASKTGSPA